MEQEVNFEEGLKKCDEKIKHAEENFGDIEIRDAVMEKAQYLQSQGKIEECIKVYMLAHDKSIGLERKMDVIFIIMQIHFKQNSMAGVKAQIEKQH